MDGGHLLLGNHPSWNRRNEWAYWRRLYYLFGEKDNPLNEEKNFVVTNATFFATPKANKLSSELLMRTLPYTLALINILQPRLIVVLSGKDLLHKIEEQNDKLQYAQLFDSYKNLFFGNFNGIPCCGIPHPSASLFREERELIQRVLSQVYKNENIQKADYKDLLQMIRTRKKYPHLSKQTAKELFDALVTRMEELPYVCYEAKEKVRRYDLRNGLQLTIANSSNMQAIAIRPKAFTNWKNIGQLPISHVDAILKCLEHANYTNSQSWLGVKDFNRLCVDDINETANKLMEEIQEVIEKINEGLSLVP